MRVCCRISETFTFFCYKSNNSFRYILQNTARNNTDNNKDLILNIWWSNEYIKSVPPTTPRIQQTIRENDIASKFFQHSLDVLYNEKEGMIIKISIKAKLSYIKYKIIWKYLKVAIAVDDWNSN